MKIKNSPNHSIKFALIAIAIMATNAVLAYALTPTKRLSDIQGELHLESTIPVQFGDWKIDPYQTSIVNPQQEAALKAIYSQILVRTYANTSGERIMLSIAYGNDQRDAMQSHYPEVCYPAQGFEVKSNHTKYINTEFGPIPVNQLETSLNKQRHEPVTYWTVVGEHSVLKGNKKKIIEMKYGLKGIIPDGLLFRVSSIDANSKHGFSTQEKFISEMISKIPAKNLPRISGLNATEIHK